MTKINQFKDVSTETDSIALENKSNAIARHCKYARTVSSFLHELTVDAETSQFDEKDAVRTALYTDLSTTFKISNDNQFCIDARTLYVKLCVKNDFSHWFKDYIKRASLVYNIDYILSTENLEMKPWENSRDSTSRQNSTNRKDYLLTVEAAKKIAMMVNTKIGNMIRDYFIACEGKLKAIVQQNSIVNHVLPQDYPSALRALANEYEAHEETKKQLAIAKPKAFAFDRFISTNGTTKIGTVLKMFGVINKNDKKQLGKNTALQFLVEKGILMETYYPNNSKDKYYEPYQLYSKHFEVRSVITRVGSKFICLFKPTGILLFYKKLVEDGNYEFPELPSDFMKQLKDFIKKFK